MASNQTENLKLSQWLATDPILRSDFNSDNKKIDAALSGVPRIVSGTYTGTGTYGADNPRTLSFSFTPAMVLITTDCLSGLPSGSIFILGQEQSDSIGNHNNSAYGLQIHLTWGESRVTWYSTVDQDKQLNKEGQIYHYFAIGLA